MPTLGGPQQTVRWHPQDQAESAESAALIVPVESVARAESVVLDVPVELVAQAESAALVVPAELVAQAESAALIVPVVQGKPSVQALCLRTYPVREAPTKAEVATGQPKCPLADLQTMRLVGSTGEARPAIIATEANPADNLHLAEADHDPLAAVVVVVPDRGAVVGVAADHGAVAAAAGGNLEILRL